MRLVLDKYLSELSFEICFLSIVIFITLHRTGQGIFRQDSYTGVEYAKSARDGCWHWRVSVHYICSADVHGCSGVFLGTIIICCASMMA